MCKRYMYQLTCNMPTKASITTVTHFYDILYLIFNSCLFLWPDFVQDMTWFCSRHEISVLFKMTFIVYILLSRWTKTDFSFLGQTIDVLKTCLAPNCLVNHLDLIINQPNGFQIKKSLQNSKLGPDKRSFFFRASLVQCKAFKTTIQI